MGRAIDSIGKVKRIACKMHRNMVRNNAGRGLSVMTVTNTLFLVTAGR